MMLYHIFARGQVDTRELNRRRPGWVVSKMVSNKEKAMALESMFHDPEEVGFMSDSKIIDAARCADSHGCDVGKFVARLAGVEERDRVLRLVMPVWCSTVRKNQLRIAIMAVPAGTFLASTIAPIFDCPEDLDFLVMVGRETYRHGGPFLNLSQSFLDEKWKSRVARVLSKGDYKYAYDELRRAIRGFAPEYGGVRGDVFETKRYDEGWASVGIISELIDNVYDALVSTGQLKPMSNAQFSAPVEREQKYSYHRKTKNGTTTTITSIAQVPGWDIATYLFVVVDIESSVPNNTVSMSIAGHKLIALAKHFHKGKATWL